MAKKLFAGAVLVAACLGLLRAVYVSGGKDALLSFAIGILIGCAISWSVKVLVEDHVDG